MAVHIKILRGLAADLPPPSSDYIGELAWVEDEGSLRYCIGGKWLTVNQNYLATALTSIGAIITKDSSSNEIVERVPLNEGDTVIFNGTDTEWTKMLGKYIEGRNLLSPSVDVITVDGDTEFDCSTLTPNQEVLIRCVNSGRLTLSNTEVKNLRPTDLTQTSTSSGGDTIITPLLVLSTGEVINLWYISSTESWQEITDPSKGNLQYDNEYWISLKGKSTNSGNSVNTPFSQMVDFTSSFIYAFSRINVLAGYQYDGGWDITNQNDLYFQGAGSTTSMYGLNTISGMSTRLTFDGFDFSSDSADTALTFSDTGGNHLLKNIFVSNNTATTFLQFGTNCSNTTADGISTFGLLAATIRDCNLKSTTVSFTLPDLPSGQFAYVKLENVVTSEIVVGSGWYLLYDADSTPTTITYTGGSTSAQLILTTPQPSGGGLLPVNYGGVIVNNSGTAAEVDPTDAGQVLMSNGFGNTPFGASWQTIALFPSVVNQGTDLNVTPPSSLSSMLHQWNVSDGNFQTATVWVDMWQTGTGTTLMKRHVCLEVMLAMDVISSSGTVNINDFIVKDITSGTQVGTLSFVYSSGGYGGESVQLKYDCAVTLVGLNINIRVIDHTKGN